MPLLPSPDIAVWAANRFAAIDCETDTDTDTGGNPPSAIIWYPYRYRDPGRMLTRFAAIDCETDTDTDTGGCRALGMGPASPE
jgi:hypothetical protein